MAITQFWKRFGDSILEAPHLTLAASLEHAPSIVVAKQHSIKFPKVADFEVDPHYDPNSHKLDLEEEFLYSKFLLMCISAWGAEALVRAVNACSLLQCMHHSSCSPKFKRLRNDAAFALQALMDNPSAESRKKADDLRRQCEASYRPHEDAPDTSDAHENWYHLGAPWFGLETALSDLATRGDYNEDEPAPSNSSWLARETVWPERAIDAAAHWSSHSLARDVVKSTLLVWALSKLAESK